MRLSDSSDRGVELSLAGSGLVPYLYSRLMWRTFASGSLSCPGPLILARIKLRLLSAHLTFLKKYQNKPVCPVKAARFTRLASQRANVVLTLAS